MHVQPVDVVKCFCFKPNIKAVVHSLAIYMTLMITNLNAEPILAPGFESWSGWISADLDHLNCAQRSEQHHCTWLSQLEIKLNQAQSATLNYKVYVGRKSLVPLLKDSRVSVRTINMIKAGTKDYKELTLVWKNNTAWVELEAGNYQLQAHVKWNTSIDTLKIPQEIARVKVIDNKGERSWVDRDQEGAIWLSERSTKASTEQRPEQESNLQIFRIWHDEVPLKLETHIQLNVSGVAREQVISGVQMEGSINTHLESTLEVDWVKDGLRVYLKPGQSSIKLISVFPNSPQQITVPEVKGSKTANQEVWVWHRNEQLRRVQLSGLSEVDPDFTALPQSLRNGTYTWLAIPGKTLKIKELQRGVQSRPSNELTLRREIWLDFDGVGFTAQDELRGLLRASSRLDVLSKSTLGRASLKGDTESVPSYAARYVDKSIPLLITKDEDNQLEGVEIRSEDLHLYADFRYPNQTEHLPALDWSEPVNSLEVKLNLPPAWRLFSLGSGAYSKDDWLSSWRMKDLFLVALITIAFFKLFGFAWANLALLSLILFHKDANIYGELLSISVGFFLLKAALEAQSFSKLVSLTFALVFLGFVSSLISLGQKDFRIALHPQLDYTERQIYLQREEEYTQRYTSSSKRIPKRDAMIKKDFSKSKSRYGELGLNEQLQKLDQNAVVQTGSGIPNWEWREHQILFDAPIEPNRSLELKLISPFWTRILFILRSTSLLAIFIMLLIRLKALPWQKLTPGRNADKDGGQNAEQKQTEQKVKSNLTVHLIFIVGLTLMLTSSVVFADEFTPSVLQTVQEQLHQEPQDLTSNQDNYNQSADSPSNSSLGTKGKSEQLNYEYIENNQPSTQLVKEWRKRLIEAKTCHGECIYVGDMDLSFDHDQVIVKVEVHAEKDSLFVLPGTLDTIHWYEAGIAQIQLPMRLDKYQKNSQVQQVAIRIPKGVHQITAKGKLPKREQLTIILGDLPKTLGTRLRAWSEVTNRNGKVSALINLKRLKQSVDNSRQSLQGNSDLGLGKVSMDYSWFSVKKSLNLGPVWQVVTQIERKYSAKAEEIILPIIVGERVLSSEHEISEEGVKVNFAAGQSQAGYLSELTPIAKLQLNAAKARWAETWTLNCGVLWRCQSSGLNPISLGGGSQASLTWRPWPGESVSIEISRPKGVKGREMTVNSLTYEFKPSTHLARGEITINLKASKGGSKYFILPKVARQINLMVDGKQQFDPAKKNRVRLPIQPGSNRFVISWQQDWTRSFGEKIPLVYTDLQGVNANHRFIVGHRWLLWTSGPAWGPAILLWGKLLFACILAFILAWRTWSPLNTWQWFLLLAGLAQHHPLSWLICILWFVAFWLRKHYWHKVKIKSLFNFGQLVLVGGTFIFLLFLMSVVEQNLLSSVDMQVIGNESTTNSLRWYEDHLNFTQGSAHIEVYSLPMWIWRTLMLVWALWFAAQLFKWLKWAWSSLNEHGGWRKVIDLDHIGIE